MNLKKVMLASAIGVVLLVVLSHTIVNIICESGTQLFITGLCNPTEVAREAQNLPLPPSEPGQHRIHVVNSRKIVPGKGLPKRIHLKKANNNLDVVRHSDGKVYFAFRSAPHHFSTAEAEIHVISSHDERNWTFEATFNTGRDLREPRFLSYQNHLFLYVTQLGTSPLRFEPEDIFVSEQKSTGDWTPLKTIGLKDTVAWRVHIIDGTPHMVVYTRAHHLYQFNSKPMQVELLKSRDGRHWVTANLEEPYIYRGGGSEADFVLTADGALFGVIRNEAGDDSGWGSKICRGSKPRISHWRCHSDKRKFDSPLMFEFDGEVYLIARRNITASGNYDQDGLFGSHALHTIWNQLVYRTKLKRCALWRYIKDENRIAFVLDLPSRGDTCFASMIRSEKADELIIYDYSSDLKGRDVPWSLAQLQPTQIYRHLLRFVPSRM